jgi:hypothetical protein
LDEIGGVEELASVASDGEHLLFLYATMNFRSQKVDRMVPSIIHQAKDLDSLGNDELIEACRLRIAKAQTE